MKKPHEKSRLACKESIAHLWSYPDSSCKEPPSTERLFVAIAGEALACLFHADWEPRIRRIENILCVIKWRMKSFWESWHESELEKLVKKAKEVKSE